MDSYYFILPTGYRFNIGAHLHWLQNSTLEHIKWLILPKASYRRHLNTSPAPHLTTLSSEADINYSYLIMTHNIPCAWSSHTFTVTVKCVCAMILKLQWVFLMKANLYKCYESSLRYIFFKFVMVCLKLLFNYLLNLILLVFNRFYYRS